MASDFIKNSVAIPYKLLTRHFASLFSNVERLPRKTRLTLIFARNDYYDELRPQESLRILSQ